MNRCLGLLLFLFLLTGDVCASQASFVRDRLLQGSATGSQVYRSTIGSVRIEAVRRAGFNPERYIAQRGASSIAGKALEARTMLDVNKFLVAQGHTDRVLATASMGMPHAAADLIRVDNAGHVLEEIQLKLSGNEAIRSLNNPKYAGMTIALPPDQLKGIQKKLDQNILKASNKGRSLSPKWLSVQLAIKSGRLTDNVAGRKLLTRQAMISNAKSIITRQFARESAKIRSLKGSIGTPVKVSTISLVRRLLPSSGKRLVKNVANASKGPPKHPVVLVIIAAAYTTYEGVNFAKGLREAAEYHDKQYAESVRQAAARSRYLETWEQGISIAEGVSAVAFSAYGVHNNIVLLIEIDRRFYRGELDRDIATGKRIIVAARIGLIFLDITATSGLMTMSSAGNISIILTVSDLALDRIQAKRTAHRQELLSHISWDARRRVCLEQLHESMRQTRRNRI